MKAANTIQITGPGHCLDDFSRKNQEPIHNEGKGVPMKKWLAFSDLVLNRFVRKAALINGEALLPSEGRPVVAIASHGPGIAWIPLAALVGKFFVDKGYGNTIGGMYPHKALFLIPGLKGYYERVLGTPTAANTVDDVVRLLKNHEIGLTGTAPEGANCLLSFDKYVAPFRSKGMIAAAIKADASICLMAHQGAEGWSRRINLPYGLTVPFTHGVNGVNIPLLPYRKLNDYMVLCRRYTPGITSTDLANATKNEARAMLTIEIDKIRAEMNRMTDEVKAMMKKKTVQHKRVIRPKVDSWQRKVVQFQSGMFPADEAYG